VGWDHHESPTQNLARILKGLKSAGVVRAAAPLGAELYLGIRRHAPEIHNIHASLRPLAGRFCHWVREHSHQFNFASRHFGEQIITRQLVQARLADSAMWLRAWACVLSKLDRDLRSQGSNGDHRLHRDEAAARYFMDMAEREIRNCFSSLFDNIDASAASAADAALAYSASLPNRNFVIPESSPVAKGTGKPTDQDGIKQFPGKDHPLMEEEE